MSEQLSFRWPDPCADVRGSCWWAPVVDMHSTRLCEREPSMNASWFWWRYPCAGDSHE